MNKEIVIKQKIMCHLFIKDTGKGLIKIKQRNDGYYGSLDTQQTIEKSSIPALISALQELTKTDQNEK